MNKLKKMSVYLRAIVLAVMSVIAFMLSLKFFEIPDIMPACLYNAGVDVLGMFICTVLCFGCAGGKGDRFEESTYWLIGLILLIGLSFFNNEWLWYVMGKAEYRTWYLFMNVLTKLFDFGLVYLFYNYVRKTLEFEGALARWMDKASWILLIPFAVLVIANMFTPICFSVDESGIFHTEALYRLVDLYLVIIAPPATYLIIRCNAPRRQKIVAVSFIFIPIVHYLITGGAHGYATQYASTLIAVIMIYTILFSDRSKKLASTQTELETATLIQNSMIPDIFPPFPDKKEFDIYGSMDPAREVGGDFYDFFLIDDDHLGMVMADVSGKGIPAALFMMMARIMINSIALSGASPAQVLRQANEKICESNETEMFVTVWLGILTISTGQVVAANAGHEYPMVRKAGGPFELTKDPHGFVVGGMEGTRFKEYSFTLEKGGTLFLYTDGLAEANNSKQELFGITRILEVLNADPDADSKTLLDSMTRAVAGFVGREPQFDDLTMMAVRLAAYEQEEELVEVEW